MVYFVSAIAAGVFYREFTKFHGYTGRTALGFVHGHLFAFGMLLFLLMALFCSREYGLLENKAFRHFYVLYNISLPFMVCTMLARGIIQVLNVELTKAGSASVSGIAGISHILMTISLFMLFAALKKTFSEK